MSMPALFMDRILKQVKTTLTECVLISLLLMNLLQVEMLLKELSRAINL